MTQPTAGSRSHSAAGTAARSATQQVRRSSQVGKLSIARKLATIFFPAMNLRPLVVLSAALFAGPLDAQVADEGTLVVRAGAREVGTESFRVTSGEAGLRITTKATYAGTRPPLELVASLERGPGGDQAFQLEHRGRTGSQVYAVLKRNRLTIRRVERGGEQASEAPGGGGIVLLADSVFALYLQLLPVAPDSGRTLTAVFPHGGRRVSFSIQRLPAAESGGTLLRLSGGLEGEIAIGNRGELLRITLPAQGLEALRKRD
jgi:hypothetical protein